MNNGKRVIIDAGHGGKDGGASGNGIVEKDLNLDISKYISNRLNELGIDNKMTRESDETLNENDRINRIKNLYPLDNNLIIISNHINAGAGDGAEIIYALRNNDKFSRIISNELENSGQNVRKFYQRRLPGNPSKDYYYILRDTANSEALIIEYGFLDSSQDDVSQLKNNWQNLAEAVVKSIASYIGVLYTPKNTVISDNSNVYTVVSGDSLWKIAKMFDITVDDLKKENKLSSNLLMIGQKLVIPSKTEYTNEYIVKAGDTLYGIAKKYNVSVDNLKDINNLSSNLIQVNQVLKIPNNEIIYIVKKGDTLYSISRKYNTTVSRLIELNNLKTDILQIGQKIIIK